MKKKIKKTKEYFIKLNNIIRTYPKYLRLIYTVGLMFAAILSIPIVFIPIGLFLFCLSMKIGIDLYIDWKKEIRLRKTGKLFLELSKKVKNEETNKEIKLW